MSITWALIGLGPSSREGKDFCATSRGTAAAAGRRPCAPGRSERFRQRLEGVSHPVRARVGAGPLNGEHDFGHVQDKSGGLDRICSWCIAPPPPPPF
jgi:hypothetical protein